MKVPFRLSEFAPDAPDFDNNVIEDLRNAIPMYGGYRGVRKASTRSSAYAVSGAPATGAHAHLLSSDFDVQSSQANDTISGWLWKRSDKYSGDLFESFVNEDTPDDNTYIW